ncbi:MAG TPA: prolipoprotein diacylglyceryl transferase, partial [Candidatus Kapabacteria bacterium]|nr:prolipoprotein diacylglyceryl transferase [Candidatus Kapabacteria bacterium]
MIPKLFQLGPISIYSYGLMMGIAFIVANVLLTKELIRRKMDANMGATITLLALIGGLAGAKLFYLFENMDEFDRGFVHAVFSPAGLTFYGGLIVAIILILVYLRFKKVSFLRIADTVAPALILAYGIGRIGCQLAGDGDYGIPTHLPWGMTYAQGTAKPSIELQEYFQKHPEEDSVYHYTEYKIIPVGRDEFGYITKFDETVHVHPTPLYETLYSVIIFLFLWYKRKNWDNDIGKLFAVYLILSGGARFFIEFLRLNPLYLSLSMS